MAIQSTTIVLQPSDFTREKGYCWKILGTENQFGLHNDPRGCRIAVYEDDRKLGPAQCLHDDIRALGKGRFSHWRHDMYLSTSDNSDPLANGREYKIVVSRPGVGEVDMPQVMHVGLTVSCNLTCRICRQDHLHGNTLTDEAIDNLVENVFPTLRELRLDVAGEPTLHAAKFKAIIAGASRHGVEVFMCTNAALIDIDMARFIAEQPAVKRIQLSFDSHDTDRLEWVRRGVRYEDVVAGVRNLVQARHEFDRDDLVLNMHAALLSNTIDDLPPLVELAKSLGVDEVSCMFGFVHDFMDVDWSVFWHQKRHNDKVDEAQALAKELGVKFNPWGRFALDGAPVASTSVDEPNKPCQYVYQWAYIDPSGGVAPCCISSTFFLGNLKTQNFKGIWYGDAYEKLRRTHTTDTPSNPKCASCYIRQGWDRSGYQAYFAASHWPEVLRRIDGGAP